MNKLNKSMLLSIYPAPFHTSSFVKNFGGHSRTSRKASLGTAGRTGKHTKNKLYQPLVYSEALCKEVSVLHSETQRRGTITIKINFRE